MKSGSGWLALALVCGLAGAPAARAAGDSYEPDNTRAAARKLALNQTQAHTIAPAGDVDWVIFTPAVKTRLYQLGLVNKTGCYLKMVVWGKQSGQTERAFSGVIVLPPRATRWFYLAPNSQTLYFKIGVCGYYSYNTASYTITVR